MLTVVAEMTKALKAKRKSFVQTLRQLAQKCHDLVTVRDDASKPKVEQFAEALKS